MLARNFFTCPLLLLYALLRDTRACAPTRQLDFTTTTFPTRTTSTWIRTTTSVIRTPTSVIRTTTSAVTRTSVRTTTTQPTTTTALTTSTTFTTTTTLPVCAAPNSNSVGLTIDQVSGEVDDFTQEATNHCASCIESRRNFYTRATDSDPINAVANEELALRVQCASTQLCVCNSQNVCCSPPTDAAAPIRIYFIPYCDNTGCIMNAVMTAMPMFTQLQCENGQTYTFERQVDMNGNFLPLNSGAYFDADRTSCRGCDNIRTDSCVGPLENGPA